jgi:hypothetical protein
MAAMSHGVIAIPPLSGLFPGVHPEIEAVITECLSADPDKRPRTMESIVKRLKRLKSEYADKA